MTLLRVVVHLLLLLWMSTATTIATPVVTLVALPTVHGTHINLSTGQVDVNPPLIRLGVILQSELLTDLFDPRLNLLYVPWTMIPLADDNMQMILSSAPCIFDSLLQDILSLLHELSVQIDGICWHAIGRIVLAKNEIGGLLIVLRHLLSVRLSFIGELFCCCAVAGIVGLFGAFEAGAAFGGFLTGEVAEAVVFLFGFVGGVVVECWGGLALGGASFYGTERMRTFSADVFRHMRHLVRHDCGGVECPRRKDWELKESKGVGELNATTPE